MVAADLPGRTKGPKDHGSVSFVALNVLLYNSKHLCSMMTTKIFGIVNRYKSSYYLDKNLSYFCIYNLKRIRIKKKFVRFVRKYRRNSKRL